VRAGPGADRTRLGGRIARRMDRLSDRKYAALSFLPGGLLLAVFVLPPIIAVFVMSLWRIELLKFGPSHFTGLSNYLNIGSDSDFLGTVPRTIWFAAATTAITVPLALACALVMNRKFRGSNVLGIIVLLPWAIAPVVTGIFWRFMFQANFGLMTGILIAFGFAHGPVPWLESSSTAMIVAIVATAWRSVPLVALILLAALKGIPRTLYKAGRMDGARSFQLFRYVTLPSIRKALLVVGILQIILSLQVFDLIFTLTGGGPGLETTVITYYIYIQAFSNLSFGYSAALAVFLLGLIVVSSASLLYLRLGSRRRRTKDAL
jgi:multiple sugar transport system permease protein